MIYVYCSRPSNGARDLLREMNARGIPARRFRAHHLPRRAGRLGPQDLVICWGDDLPGLDLGGARFLNQTLVRCKLHELEALREKQVPTPRTSREPLPGFLGRMFNHQGGADLLHERAHPDYYVERLHIVDEYRVHVFRGAVIRTGKKVPRVGVPVHPWIRSYDGGWKIDYGVDREFIPNGLRPLAKTAVEALGYDFGAVDLAITDRGQRVVLEVNSAPGVEGGTIRVYVDKIISFSEERPIV